VTVTIGRWKVSLLQDHENVTVVVVAMLYYNCCSYNYCSSESENVKWRDLNYC
jgi:hypothetical protein